MTTTTEPARRGDFCVASFMQDEENPIAALMRYGFPQEVAEFEVAQRTARQGGRVVIPFRRMDDQETLLLERLSGKWKLWRRTGELFEEHETAFDFAKKMAAAEGKEFSVFALGEDESRTKQ